MFSLEGKVALVTGAGRNVGAGIAKALASQGAHVIVNDFHLERAERIVSEIVAAGGAATPSVFDVTDLAGIRAAIAGLEADAGPIDILVNNAGTGGPNEQMKMARFVDTPDDYWRGIADVNLFGVMNCCKATMGGMLERGWGRIITVSSGAGQTGLDIGVSTYGAAKAGAIGFMRHLAVEGARQGVTCNTISLGLVLEDAHRVQHLADQIPVGRLGKPEDPGYLAVYLASPEASWITGQTIGLNGGGLMI